MILQSLYMYNVDLTWTQLFQQESSMCIICYGFSQKKWKKKVTHEKKYRNPQNQKRIKALSLVDGKNGAAHL